MNVNYVDLHVKLQGGMQPVHICAQFGHCELFGLLCDQYGVNPLSAKYVS